MEKPNFSQALVGDQQHMADKRLTRLQQLVTSRMQVQFEAAQVTKREAPASRVMLTSMTHILLNFMLADCPSFDHTCYRYNCRVISLLGRERVCQEHMT
jgi:hypothetical protein